jgi:hypothetical protein
LIRQIELLGRIKHVFRISGGREAAESKFIKRFKCVYWSLPGEKMGADLKSSSND